MKKIHLILSHYMLEREDYDESYPNSWQSVCKEAGIEYTIMQTSPYDDPDGFNKELPDYSDKIPVCFGTIEFCRKIKECFKDIEHLCFFSDKELECTNYYPQMHPLIPMVNKEYIAMEFGQLIKNWDKVFDYFDTNILFFRPNDNTKTFIGGNFLKSEDGKNLFLEHCDKDHTGWGKEVEDNTLVIIAPSKKIISEYRFFICNKEVVTGSQYNRNNTIDVRADYLEKAYKIANLVAKQDYQPDIAYTCDVAEMNCEGGEMKVIELNSGSCSGLYEMNKRKILTACIKEVEKLNEKESI